MKIILLLNRDIHAALALNLLFPALKSHEVKIILSEKVGRNSTLAPQLLQLKKFEQDEMDALFSKIDEEENVSFSRKHKSSSRPLDSSFRRNEKEDNAPKKFLTFNQIAKFFNHEITTYQDINSASALEEIKNFSPHLIISIRFGQILQSLAIAIPTHGVINLHSGILPNYRGVMPTFWAILNGENKIGCTLHHIDDRKIDSGPIIQISSQEILHERSFMANVSALCAGGCRMIEDFLTKISSTEIAAPAKFSTKKNATSTKFSSQNNSTSAKENATDSTPATLLKGKYFSFPAKNDIENFQKIMPLVSEKDHAEIFSHWIK